MSVYNGEKYLAEAIESVLNQTFTSFEFIIINDGSTDESLLIINSYMEVDERIVVISRENRGLIASLNEGIEIARGKYIARMDADDISMPTRFEKQIEFLERNQEVGVCGTWVEVFGDDIRKKHWVLPVNDKELKVRLLFSIPFVHPSVMMRKSIIDRNGLRYQSAYVNAEDYKLWLDFSWCANFSNLPQTLLKYRYRSDSVSRVADSNESNERFRIINRIHGEVLGALGLRLSHDEQLLHFNISLNERILSNRIQLRKLVFLFKKILKSNDVCHVYDQEGLIEYLSLMYLKIAVFQLRKMNLYFVFAPLYGLFWRSLKPALMYVRNV